MLRKGREPSPDSAPQDCEQNCPYITAQRRITHAMREGMAVDPTLPMIAYIAHKELGNRRRTAQGCAGPLAIQNSDIVYCQATDRNFTPDGDISTGALDRSLRKELQGFDPHQLLEDTDDN